MINKNQKMIIGFITWMLYGIILAVPSIALDVITLFRFGLVIKAYDEHDRFFDKLFKWIET